MKKLITLFIAVLGSAFNTSAQEIKGVVVDATSKEVVPSATIIMEYSDKTDRTVSNDKGELVKTEQTVTAKTAMLLQF